MMEKLKSEMSDTEGKHILQQKRVKRIDNFGHMGLIAAVISVIGFISNPEWCKGLIADVSIAGCVLLGIICRLLGTFCTLLGLFWTTLGTLIFT